MSQAILILGSGGNSFDIVDLIDDINDAAGKNIYHCAGFLDDDHELHGTGYRGIQVLGPLRDVQAHPDHLCVLAIGSPASYRDRAAILDRLNLPPERFVTLVHPDAVISPSVEIGPGSVIFAHSDVGAHARLGAHTFVLQQAMIGHNCTVGAHTCIASGVRLSGGVTIEPDVYVGSNACLINEIHVGRDALIGMGSVVLADVPAATVVVGNPARPLRPVS